MSRLASLCCAVLVGACGMLPGEDAKVGLNRAFAAALDRRLQTVAARDAIDVRDLCVVDEPCALVRVAPGLAPCPALSPRERCLALEVRDTLLNAPSLRTTIERDTALFCSFHIPPIEQSGTVTRDVVGCESPGDVYEEHYRGRPTLCVFAIDEDGGVVESFAVRDGQRVRHDWCASNL